MLRWVTFWTPILTQYLSWLFLIPFSCSYQYRISDSGQYKNVPHPENTANKTALLSCKYPRHLLSLSPPVQMISSVFFLLICSCPLFWSRSGKDMLLLLWSARWNKCFLLLHSPVIRVSCFATPSPYIRSFFFSPDASLLSSIRNKCCPMTTYTLRFGSIPLHR